MSKLWMFLWAVLDQWAVLMTGGMVTALLTAVQYWREKPFSWRFQKWVIVIFIAVACFLAWREEYDRAQRLVEEKADLQGQLRELRSNKGFEEHLRTIQRLETANAQTEAQLRASQEALSALELSLKPRQLSPEEREKFIAALAAHDGRQFGVIEVTTTLGCHECMMYRDELVRTMNSVAGWQAHSVVEMVIRADVTGIIIGIKDSNSPPTGVDVLREVLKAAELPFTVGTAPYLPPNKFILIIGNKP
jgi:hypothetical protein